MTKPKQAKMFSATTGLPKVTTDAEREAHWWKQVQADVNGEIAVFPKSSKPAYVKCAHAHPPLKISTKNGEVTVYGGACGDPVHKGLDIYVALDHGTAHDPQAWPWHGSRQFIYFPITDMSTPKDAAEFKLMISWLGEQIMVHKKSVHIGCIGGHGRTGMVLAALVKDMSGEEDAITYVRKNYCDKVVETTAQVKWLNTHFGIKVVDGSKGHSNYYSGYGDTTAINKVLSRKDMKIAEIAEAFGSKAEEVKPFRAKGNIWGIA